MNRSKSDQGPEEWLPPPGSARCTDVAIWVAVKGRWSLSMDERERVVVGNVLRDCARAPRLIAREPALHADVPRAGHAVAVPIEVVLVGADHADGTLNVRRAVA